MMNFDGKDVANEFQEAFGFPIENVTVKQAWFLAKLAKHCRGRCRSNAALNNYLNRNFKGLNFKEVAKKTADGKEYDGLEITAK